MTTVQVLPRHDSLGWSIQSKRGELPCCTFQLVLRLVGQGMATETPAGTAQVAPPNPHQTQEHVPQTTTISTVQTAQFTLNTSAVMAAGAPSGVLPVVPKTSELHTATKNPPSTDAQAAAVAIDPSHPADATADMSDDGDCIVLHTVYARQDHSADKQPAKMPGVEKSTVDAVPVVSNDANQPTTASEVPTAATGNQRTVPSSSGANLTGPERISTADLASMLEFGVPADEHRTGGCDTLTAAHNLAQADKDSTSRGAVKTPSRKRALGHNPPASNKVYTLSVMQQCTWGVVAASAMLLLRYDVTCVSVQQAELPCDMFSYSASTCMCLLLVLACRPGLHTSHRNMGC